jgi:hypothetical protein
MIKRTMTALVVVLLCTLLVSGVALSMSSSNYRLDWFTPLTGSGGGQVGSANYAANFTVGQSISGAIAGTNHSFCLGYWCRVEVEVENKIYLPSLFR